MDCELSPVDKWVTAECPARIDIAGGWSDTAPITYEQGGAVVNAAITVDGQVCFVFLTFIFMQHLMAMYQVNND